MEGAFGLPPGARITNLALVPAMRGRGQDLVLTIEGEGVPAGAKDIGYSRVALAPSVWRVANAEVWCWWEAQAWRRWLHPWLWVLDDTDSAKVAPNEETT